MHGFVVYAMQVMVIDKVGEEVWQQLKKEAGFNVEGSILINHIYDDEIVYKLVGVASKSLGISSDELLETFGCRFFKFCQESGHEKILRLLGSTPEEFLQNLDNLHHHLETTYPGMQAPFFRCENTSKSGELILHYYSKRQGLENIVIGIVRVRPHFEFSWNNVKAHTNNIFILETVPSLDDDRRECNMRLKGQMVYDDEKEIMLFLCFPVLFGLDALKKKGLYLSDLPVHDATRDFILLSENFVNEYKLMENLEKLTDDLQMKYKELNEERSKTDLLLYSVLPVSVANALRENRPVEAKRYSEVTLMFSGIINFAQICSRNSDGDGPMKIVNILNEIYTLFDVYTDQEKNPNVYKVETVMDKYFVVSGLPYPCETHSTCIANLALDMMQVAGTIRFEEEAVQICIGIHTGEVVAGVIGNRTPRYCLFGDAVNITSRIETSGIENKINISESTYRSLHNMKDCKSSFDFEYRGEVKVKGKESAIKIWFLSRHT